MHASDVARGRQILTRFLLLAEERLAYLTELYETGRWARYFSEAALLENVRDAKAAVASWSLLVSTEALPNNRPVDLTWLDGPRPLPPRRPIAPYIETPQFSARFTDPGPRSNAVAGDLLPPTDAPIQIDVPVAAAPPEALPILEPPVLPPWQNALDYALDYALLEQRYSLLRKAG